jgi:hypothetical protein
MARVESAQIMELALNLAWSLLAIAMTFLWLRQAPRGASSRRAQAVALGLLLVILLPAISMTDDLMAAQNPAEVDCCLGRDHRYSRPQATFPVVPALPALAFAGMALSHPRLAPPGIVAAPVFDSPALASILNRPPPGA